MFVTIISIIDLVQCSISKLRFSIFSRKGRAIEKFPKARGRSRGQSPRPREDDVHHHLPSPRAAIHAY
ncbi:hypothetical protein GIB67_035696 [Kingdonia uniflora]|uniref:Uncharacterized protein n=1 Tax=Kingdonia uniflora TaxID=39325 RepID=A0A7J7MIQ6_9MAGN|nr:hypothetical protein GIB67_035696 [Kingdonia uniflora]